MWRGLPALEAQPVTVRPRFRRSLGGVTVYQVAERHIDPVRKNSATIEKPGMTHPPVKIRVSGLGCILTGKAAGNFERDRRS